MIERLEERQLLATIVVNTLADNTTVDNLVSLREAIQAANTNTSVDGSASGGSSDFITFHPNLTGTIRLTAGELTISEHLTIVGPGADRLTISGNNASRIFNLTGAGADMYQFIGLTLTEGNGMGATTSSGSAILLNDPEDTLLIADSVIRNNVFSGQGAVAVNSGTISVSGTSFINNQSAFGGALYVANTVNAKLVNSTIHGNTATTRAGGIGLVSDTNGGSSRLTLINSTIMGNQAPIGAAVEAASFNNSVSTVVEYLNSVFADNTGSDNFSVANSTGGTGAQVISLGYNLSDDSSGVMTAFGDKDNVSPNLHALETYGGATLGRPPTVGSPVIDAGLSGYRKEITNDAFDLVYTMNETTGTTAANSGTTSGFTGTIVGSSARTTGVPLNGETHVGLTSPLNDGYVSLPVIPASTTLTFSGWAYVTGGSGTYRSLITSRSDDSTAIATDATGFTIYAASNDRWEFWTGNGAQTSGLAGEWEVVTGPAVRMNEWTHIVATFQPTAAPIGSVQVGTSSLYINGRLAASINNTFYQPNTTRPTYLGAGGTEGSTASAFFVGAIDEVGFNDSALSAEQVSRLYQSAAIPSRDQRGTARLGAATDMGAMEGSVSSIGINFVGGRTGSAGSFVNGAAGIVSQSNWNNVADNELTHIGGGQSGAANDLRDDSGVATSAAMTWGAGNTWTVSTAAPADGHSQLMQGYLDGSPGSPATVSVSAIPYSVYDLIIYTDGDSTGAAGAYTVLDGDRSYSVGPVSDTTNWPVGAGNGVFVQGVPGGSGNYIVFRNLSSSTLGITATATSFRAPINGLQIVGRAPRLVVNQLGDTDNKNPADGMTLREAVNFANTIPGPQEISFALDFSSPQTIVLGGTALTLSDDVFIVGPGAEKLLVDGDRRSSVFVVNSGVKASLSDFTVQRGLASRGGGIATFGQLTLDRMRIRQNETNGDFFGGGGVYFATAVSDAALVVNDSLFQNNVSSGMGGGISGWSSAKVVINGSTFERNQATEGGGAKFQNGDIRINNSTFSANTASSFGGGLQLGATPYAAVVHSTFTGNVATTGGGIHVFGTNSNLFLQSSLLANNSATTSPNLDFQAGANTVVESNNRYFTSSPGVVSALANHGGSTATHLPIDATTIDEVNPTTTYSASVLADGPTAYWRFNEDPSGLVASNAGTSLGTNGTFVGGPKGTAGLLTSAPGDAAVAFDGLDDVVTVPDNINLNTAASTAAYSIELRFQANNTQTRQVIYEQGGTNAGFNVYIEGGRIYVGVWSGDGAYRSVSNEFIATGQHHVVLVFNSVIGLTGYFNGMRMANSTTGTVGAIPSHSTDIGIGGMRQETRFVHSNTTATGNGFFFNGVIDEVAIYRTALSGTQVINHIAAANRPLVDQRGVARPLGSALEIGSVEFLPESLVSPIVVNTLGDVDDGNFGNGQTTLREAINVANRQLGHQTITFDLGTEPRTIELAGSELVLGDPVTIQGPVGNILTIDANGASRVFHVMPGVTATLSDLKLTGGSLNPRDSSVSTTLDRFINNYGGAILNEEGNLTVRRSEMTGNSAAYGGAIANYGAASLNLQDSFVSSNNAVIIGAAIYSNGFSAIANVSVLRSTIDQNSGSQSTIESVNTQLDIRSSTVSRNSPTTGVNASGTGSLAITDSTIVAHSGRDITSAIAATVKNTIVSDLGIAGTGSFTGDHNLILDPSNTGGFTHGANANIVGKDNGSGGRASLGLNELFYNSGFEPYLLYYGGFAPTFQLLPGSPAINAGESTELTDQRGPSFSRVVGSAADIGAYEVQATTNQTLVVTTNSDLVTLVDGVDVGGQLGLREAIMLANSRPGNDTIQINLSAGSRISMIDGRSTFGRLIVGDDVSIVNMNSGTVIVDGNLKTAVFDILKGVSAQISGLTVTGGSESGGFFGGIIIGGGSLSLRDSQVQGNNGPGIFVLNPLSTLDLIRSTITNNTVGLRASGRTRVLNSTISNNLEGIRSSSTSVSIVSSTVTENEVVGGITGSGKVFLSNSIVSGNASSTASDIASSVQVVSLGGNVLHEGAGSAAATVWSSGTGANGHAYEVVSVPAGITWEDARQAALAAGGYLATINSTEENDFVFNLINQSTLWRASGGFGYGPWIGGSQPAGATEPAGGWSWVTGEAFSYSNWLAGEPNNFGGAEDRIAYFNTSTVPAKTWGDIPNNSSFAPIAYVVEYGGNATYLASDVVAVPSGLASLVNNGGRTETKGPLAGSPAMDLAQRSLVTPTAVAVTAGSEFFPANQLINNSGLSPTPTLSNYAGLTHASAASGNTAWVTDATSIDYFNATPANPNPVLTFTLGQLTALTDLVVWGYQFNGANNNEAKDFLLEFSTDGGTTYGESIRLTHQRTAGAAETLSFGTAFIANRVKMTITDNHFGAAGATGGDRVGLGEVKFISGVNHDQRGVARPSGAASDSGAVEGAVTELGRSSLIVNAFGDGDDGDPNNGSMTLREAIGLANRRDGLDTITFSNSIGNPKSIMLGDQELRITDGVEILGPGADFLTIDAGKASRIFNLETPADESVRLVGMTLQGGQDSSGSGSAIRQNRGQLILEDSSVKENLGTAILVQVSSTATVNRTTFENNGNSFVQGGAVNNQGVLNVSHSVFRNNLAITGGGIFNFATLNVNDSLFVGNQGSSLGGGIFHQGSSAIVERSTFRENTSSNGAGFYALTGVTISDSLFERNTATVFAGAMTIFNGSSRPVDVTRTSFIDNSGGQGGAIWSYGSANFTGSTFSGNQGKEGGAIYVGGGPFTMNHSTVTNNRASIGGGLRAIAAPIITDSIIAENFATSYGSDIEPVNLTSLGNNLLFTGAGGATQTFNNRRYEVVSVPAGVSWETANKAATAAGGYLARIDDAAENNFVKSLINQPQFWRSPDFGGTFVNYGPWIGAFQPKGSIEPAGGFIWQNGSNLSFTDWLGGEPSNSGGVEDAVHYFSITTGSASTSGAWNDSYRFSTAPVAYVIEYDTSSLVASDRAAQNPLLGPLQNNGGLTPTHAIAAGSPAENAAGTQSSYAEEVLVDSPRVYYRLDETSGTTAVDSSSNGSNAFAGTVYGSPLNVGNRSMPGLGSAPRFANGLPFGSVNVPSLGTFGTVTVEAWVNPASRPAAGDFDVIYNTRNFNAGALHLQFNENGELIFGISAAGQGVFGTATNFPLNTWTHIVASYSNPTNTASVYVNGVLLGTATFSGNQDAVLTDATIGTWNGNSRAFDGMIDEVAAYPSALTAARALAHYQAGRVLPGSEQRGSPFARKIGAAADIGAYERQTVTGLNLVVDTTVDEYDGDFSAGDLSLREAIALAAGSVGANTITFSPTVFNAPRVINVTQGELVINDSVTIDANPALPVVLRANGQSRVMNIGSGAFDVTLRGLAIQGGTTSDNNDDASDSDSSGGGILWRSTGTLKLDHVSIVSNITKGRFASGGGLAATTGKVIITDSTIAFNQAQGERAIGGGIWTDAATVSIIGSMVSSNSTSGMYGEGAGIATLRGAVTLVSSTVTDNGATGLLADGGGGFIGSSTAKLTINNSIVAANNVLVGSNGSDLSATLAGTLAVQHSLIGSQQGNTLNASATVDPVTGNLVGTSAARIAPNLGPITFLNNVTSTQSPLPGSVALDAGSTYASIVGRDLPTAWWRLNETTGTVANNAIAGAAQGTYTGTVTHPVSGAVADGKALGLDGTTAYVAANAIPISKSFTVEAWAMSATPNWNQSGWIASSRSQNGFIIHPVADQRRWEAWVADGSSLHFVDVHFPTDIQGWHHYAITYDDTTRIARMYFDGVEVGSRDFTAVSGFARLPTANVNLLIGADNPASGAPTRFGSGAVDEVAIYDTALSPSRLLAHATKSPGLDQRGVNRRIDLPGISNGPDTIDIGAVEILGVSVANVSASESTGALNFAVSLSDPLPVGQAVTVVFSTTTGGSATPGADFTAVTNQLITFSGGGSQTQIVTVNVLNDGLFESNETVNALLTNVNGAILTGGGTAVGTIVNDDAATLRVVSMTPNASGVDLAFSRAMNVADLNLYDASGGSLGVADLTLVGGSTGNVSGSIVVSADRMSASFIATGGILPADTYTLTLRSAANSWKDTVGGTLDGNGDGTAGDNLTSTFAVTAPVTNEVVVSLPDFARGYGQAVNLPLTTNAGIPISISNGTNVSSVRFDLVYDPALLDISAITTAIAGATATLGGTPGERTITVSKSSGAFSATSGLLDIGRLTATVPNTAAYAGKHLLRIQNLQVLDASVVPAPLPSRADHGIHVAAYAGDTNGNGAYSSGDTTLLQRMIVGTGTGFTAYQLADPRLIADITRNGILQSGDATLLQRVIVGTAVTQMPPLPTGITAPAPGGPDPRLYIPRDLNLTLGDAIDVPVRLQVTDPSGISIAGLDLAIEYDPDAITVDDFRIGSMLGDGFGVAINHSVPGVIRVSLTSDQGPSFAFGEEGTVFLFRARAKEGVCVGATALNLLANRDSTATQITDNAMRILTLVPNPTNASDDDVDGLLTVHLDEEQEAVDTWFASLVDG